MARQRPGSSTISPTYGRSSGGDLGGGGFGRYHLGNKKFHSSRGRARLLAWRALILVLLAVVGLISTYILGTMKY